MIYYKKYLPVEVLVENVCNYELKGIYRPQAYVKGAGQYCTECQIDLVKKGIMPGESIVIKAVLYAPHGFGEHLKQGSLLTLQNGLDVEAKAVILDIEDAISSN